jgi:hypothetical protein
MDYAMFAADWPEKISHLLVDRDKSDRDVMLVCRFLEQVRYVQWEREQDNPQIAPRTGETSIENITGKLIEDAGKAPTTPRGEAYFDWCTSRVWLIATPESGLPSATAARVLEALPPFGDEVKKFFTEHRDDMRRARFERARANLKAIPQDESEAKITDANVHAVLKIIDTVLGPNHPWVSRFDVWDPSHLERSRPATEAGVVGPPLTTPASPARRRARRP